MYPKVRLRRKRLNHILRDHFKETRLSRDDLIYPIFVIEGGRSREIERMPGLYQYCIEELLRECEGCLEMGLRSFLLFGIPKEKNDEGLTANVEEGIVQRALKALKKRFGQEILLTTDICFCGYTHHGHCGVLDGRGNVDNDKTLELIGQQALSHCDAGADMMAPSGMMDGVVKKIRSILDTNDLSEIPILSYSIKYNSSYYGPFRSAVGIDGGFKNREGYQMDIGNQNEAILEAKSDIEEGADILMIKPALAYLDVIKMIKDEFRFPLAGYNVSGEYSMIKSASLKGYIEEKKVVIETLLSMKRAGCDIIISYFSKDMMGWLIEED